MTDDEGSDRAGQGLTGGDRGAMAADPAGPRPDGDGVRWLGHATCVIDVAGVRLVTDPLLRRHAGALRRRGGLAPESASWAGSDAVLLSHLHHDHAHVGSLRSAASVVLGPPTTARWAIGHGLAAVGLLEGQWWDVTPGAGPGAQSGGADDRQAARPGRAVAGEPDEAGEPNEAGAARTRVRTVRAVHGHRPMPHRPNPAVGFVVEAAASGSLPARRIWFAGDTELYPEMDLLPQWAGGPIDLALIPVGGWGPRLSGGHMGPQQAAEACRRAGVRAALPIHWGTLHAPLGSHLPRGWMDRAGVDFAHELVTHAPDCRPIVLNPGERTPLP